ncbi:MAG: GIY-YIG nuclease family protein [Candidatus Aminicenantes bacterium]|nr:GIY-YIG nuclease family protein [Candidatus Aminicenantes bacterium]NIM79183.1 GIY-YIG nuclease family protein [Candidatus Aminicenantes bacterium]NIN18469.1 GIY-YIG nuclease family protein [Candidatus Aminicenantes bacterium]NIN42357.1 GIY-YIG nuclease family protein [Candidatus Aminicenantes bacterium]NIN85123.1 GIY-YIG nuclease family protein [Candidatus Aminicenantes bacterium]
MKKTKSLSGLEVLVLDCQATGANPESNHLMEIGWSHTQASQFKEFSESMIESYLVRLPEGEEIPRRVTRITGLKTEDFDTGVSAEIIWEKLSATARQIASANQLDLCPTIIHYSRFEEVFLHHLHQQYGAKEPFPFEVICTHKVTRRLFPDLPRKGLRAIAGYLGYSVPEFRRSAHHTAASIFIWQRVVRLLKENNVETLEELKEWLKKPLAKATGSGMDYPMEAELRLNLPKKPGIYRMSRSNGDLLYIGKATSLKHRVNSYFHKRKRSAYSRNTLEMLTQAAHLEVIVTGSALEAALLEADEIKKHSPPYNVALRQREREIVFFSRDLREYSPTSDSSHPVGPMPSKESLTAFAAIGAFLEGQFSNANDNEINIPALVLGIPPEYAPEVDCFKEGTGIFQQRHDQLLKKFEENILSKGLMILGKQLRRQKLEELALAESTAEEENGDTSDQTNNNETIETGEERTWTPESVANVMEGIIRFGAHLIRRARWYCLLSESSLAWTTGETAGRQRRLLVFQEGTIIRQEDITQEQEIPIPPGYQQPFPARQKNFDVMTYDRLRVLTTELRRLVSDEIDRHVQLHLSPKVVLGRQQLLNLLQWV